jgi:hypothetical protein
LPAVDVSALTKLALFAANAEADGIAIKLIQAIAIIEARVALLGRAEPNEKAKKCVIWDNPSSDHSTVIISVN